MTDEQLVKLAQSGDNQSMEELLNRYRGLVRSRARGYFLIGAEPEDLLQEGMIGLFKAVRDYAENKNVPFSAFAALCVNRQFSTAVKSSLREKHKPLNNYVSLSVPTGEEGDPIPLWAPEDPASIYEGREEFRSLLEKIGRLLSPLEKKVLGVYLKGVSYEEISAALGISRKQTDNALQRIKKKLSQS